jgi:hypothetical protein
MKALIALARANTPRELARHSRSEIPKRARVVKQSDARVD